MARNFSARAYAIDLLPLTSQINIHYVRQNISPHGNAGHEETHAASTE